MNVWPVDELAKAYCKHRRLAINKAKKITAQNGTTNALAIMAIVEAEEQMEDDGP